MGPRPGRVLSFGSAGDGGDRSVSERANLPEPEWRGLRRTSPSHRADAADGSAPGRVVIVEDEPLFLDLLRVSLGQRPELEVVAAYREPVAALREIPSIAPDVALLDIDLAHAMNGVELGLRLREPLPRLGIVLLTNLDAPEFASMLAVEEVAGWSYLLKRSATTVETLARAIDGARNHLLVMDPAIVGSRKVRPQSRIRDLSEQETKVLLLLAEGYTNAAIGRQLHFARKTVEHMVNRIYDRMGVRTDDPSANPRVVAVRQFIMETRGDAVRG